MATILLSLTLSAALLAGCGQPAVSETTQAEAGTFIFTDSCGRRVELPKQISKAAPSGWVAQMILYSVFPDKLAGWSKKPAADVLAYFPASMKKLPEFGQFYGAGDTLNLEALIDAKPDVIIDLGDKKPTHAEDMDKIQQRTGIPTIFIEANLSTFASAYRTLGDLLDAREQAEKCAAYIEATIALAKANAAKIPENQRKTVMYGTGVSGRDCNARGSIHADVIELVGAVNAVVVPEVSFKGGGNTISMEELIKFDPDVILLASGGPFDTIGDDQAWAGLRAVQNGLYYEIPSGPYDFMSNPPSVNRMIGIKWLGNLLYPDLYDYDMVQELKTFYKLFWHFDLSDQAAEKLLEKSTFLRGKAR